MWVHKMLEGSKGEVEWYRRFITPIFLTTSAEISSKGITESIPSNSIESDSGEEKVEVNPRTLIAAFATCTCIPIHTDVRPIHFLLSSHSPRNSPVFGRLFGACQMLW